ncbi:MAG: hypothetical protein A2V21_309900 [Deltaproteobacteria bacterium GWC2_55_46]|nr:MAG: hypothetical protein A2Z79_04000 [Deltaproteobacteria bacterium GWA2_55_82]OGQ64091.1 MAG: hypothetical protein A3I81_10375 [Deltaproteobacteria bacterium RIFCSPLOWO2_02_FULL_55_12]OIJ74543.1 MAG: hypothetical protein A2V21_309900 [Deltaproteobacteria bacterium GWC2_55_46]HCY10731.1 hypothetical protein [Deltaproteobacteria bacterium]
MKKAFLFLAAAAAAVFLASSPAKAEVNVNIGINLPVIGIAAPPSVVVIPGTYIYFAPDVINIDVFFFGGYWWRPHHGRWYRAVEFGDPWIVIDARKVPGPLLRIPPRWRDIPPGHDRIPYGQLKKNWRQWEKERRWDKARHEMKREMKEERREHKQEHRKDHPGQGRGRHDD